MVQLRPSSDADPLLPPLACPQPLHGRNVAILCGDSQRADVLALQHAATELGARVALVAPPEERADGRARAHTGRVLGRLYDAVVCIELPAALVRELGEAAGVPVLSAQDGDLLHALLSATGR